MATIQVTLSEAQKDFIEGQVAECGHASVEDFIQALILEAQKRKAWAKVEKLVTEGLTSGTPIPATEEFWGEKKIKFLDKYPGADQP